MTYQRQAPKANAGIGWSLEVRSSQHPISDRVVSRVGYDDQFEWWGVPDAALSVWIVQQQEVTEETLAFQHLLFLRHPDIPSDVWATPPPRHPAKLARTNDQSPLVCQASSSALPWTNVGGEKHSAILKCDSKAQRRCPVRLALQRLECQDLLLTHV